MADPRTPPRQWTDDLVAFGDDRGHDLRSLAQTRAHVLFHAKEPTQMRFFKLHPVLSAALALGFVAAIGGGAYAVSRAYINIDPDESASEIEQHVQAQLESQHIAGTVHADKHDDGHILIHVDGVDPSALPDFEMRDTGSNGSAGSIERGRVKLQVQCDLADADIATLTNAVAEIKPSGNGAWDADAIAAATRALADHGFGAATVTGIGGDLTVTVTTPPTAVTP